MLDFTTVKASEIRPTFHLVAPVPGPVTEASWVGPMIHEVDIDEGVVTIRTINGGLTTFKADQDVNVMTSWPSPMGQMVAKLV